MKDIETVDTGTAKINTAPNSSCSDPETDDGKSKASNTEAECEEIPIKSLSDLILLNDVPNDVFTVSVILGLTQIIIYGMVIAANREITDSKANYYTLAIALLYAAFTISSSTVEAFNKFNLHSKVKTAEKFSSTQSNLFDILELLGQVLLIVTIVYTVPQQNDPISIILECTGLLAVSTVDEAVLDCLKVTGTIPIKLKKALIDAEEKKTQSHKASYFGFLLLLYLGLLFYSLDYNHKI